MTQVVDMTMARAQAVVDPWYESLHQPAAAQEAVLQRLLTGYAQTDYGASCGAASVGSYDDFRAAFPARSYAEFKPLIDRVMAGDTSALLPEAPIALVFTKGTSGQPKTFAWTSSHTAQIDEYYRRVVSSYALVTGNVEWMSGFKLNLSSSGNLRTVKVGDQELALGFSIAVALRHMNTLEDDPGRVTPSFSDLDRVPKEPTRENWERRYEMAFEIARELDVTHFGNMPNVIIGFGKYLQRKHGVRPRDLWQMQLLLSGGAPGTFSRYLRAYRELYGDDVDIRELFIATEGCYGAQLDERRAWCPMYDHLFFEVQTLGGLKPLHDMFPGEIGSLIVSTPEFPRYRTGDLVLAYESPYFRCIGRENTKLAPFAFGPLNGRTPLTLARKRLPTFR